jgi:hypothetical protein
MGMNCALVKIGIFDPAGDHGDVRRKVCWMRSRYGALRRALTVLLLATAATACDSDQPTDTPPTTATSTPSPSSDPRAGPAVEGYKSFWTTANNASRAPLAAGEAYPPAADFTRFSFDPVQSQYTAFLASMAADGVRYRGNPPTPRVTVTKVELEAKPYPTVILHDCQSPAPDWRAYVTDTGELVPRPSTTIQPPYLVTAKMIFYRGHWGLQSTSTDSSRTCSA